MYKESYVVLRMSKDSMIDVTMKYIEVKTYRLNICRPSDDPRKKKRRRG
jgi:hypothetical protein